MRTKILAALFFATLGGLVFTFAQASALSGSQFQAGRIIDDNVFFNGNTMAASDIQNFLNSKVPTCDTNGEKAYGGTTRAAYGSSKGYPPPYTCLKDYSQNTGARPYEAGLCNAYNGGVKTAAQIIHDVAQVCGINPKALIVLLEKEQSLVTDDWPWSVQYKSATGFGCPDTAPCDPDFGAFFDQVYYAARQFKKYAKFPEQYGYRAFRDNYIQYNPNASCGGSNVHIQNQATAGLYVYTPYQPNAAALANLYGSGDGCSAYGNRNFWRLFSDWFGSTQTNEVFISYKSHISYMGWTGSTINGGMTGTTGQGKSMQAFKLNGEVEYSSYNYETGWQPTINRGMISGTTGQHKPIQAVKINPIGSLASKYDIYYRTHVSYVGWMGWAKNGETAGVTGDAAKNIEAIEIYLTIKGSGAPGSVDNKYQNLSVASYNPSVSLNMTSHVGGVGWQPTVRDNMVTGTTEQNRSIEALTLALNNNSGLSGTIKYSSHLSGIGWQSVKSSGDMSGTTGQYRDMEAVRISLTDQLGENYDIWYRGYVEYMGWLGWAKNGDPAGSIGSFRQLEGLEVRIVPKNSISLPTSGALYNPKGIHSGDTYHLRYSAHVSYIGWITNIMQNSTGGTTGQSKALEGISITELTSMLGEGSINCMVYVKNTGWTSSTSQGSTCGTAGQSKALQAIRLDLIGSMATKYDIYYRVHLSHEGWKDWVKNNEVAGTPSSGNNIEAITVKLVAK